MWAKVESDEVTELYRQPKALIMGDVQYPRNIFELWSASELEAIGIYKVVEDNTNRKDNEYYINSNITYTYDSGTVTASYTSATARVLADQKAFKTKEVNHVANSLLQQYDWYTLRAADGGTAVPSAVATYRAAVRTTANSMTTKIGNVANVDALAALFVYNTDDPPTRPLGKWPDQPS